MKFVNLFDVGQFGFVLGGQVVRVCGDVPFCSCLEYGVYGWRNM